MDKVPKETYNGLEIKLFVECAGWISGLNLLVSF